jgi:divalent metal cation (Fe/Co/Zn/Cd) transporter
MGASPEPEFYDRVRAISFAIPGVRDVHNVIAEQVGEQIHLGMHIEVSRGITIEEADSIADAVHDAICATFDDIWLVVHADPQRATPAPAPAGATT